MRVAIVGSGYVGLVTGVGLASRGHDVVCADLQHERVELINAGRAPFHEPGLEALLAAELGAGRFRATCELKEALSGSRVSLIAVGTPGLRDGIDLSQVAGAARQIGAELANLPAPHVVAVKSTVVPGTTDGLVRDVLQTSSGLRLGEFGLCANPEFLREGSAVQDFLNPDRIVIGAADPAGQEALLELYEGFDCPVLQTSPLDAELVKYASNGLLASLVSFSNELARFCESLPGADLESVLEGLHLDRRLSPRVDGARVEPGILAYLRAGCGYGGSCLPKDVDALRALGRQRGVPTPLLDAVVSVNRGRANDLVALLERELGGIPGRCVAVLGLAFKPGTDDVRDSPAARVIGSLREAGAEVRSYDPLVRDETSRDSLEDAVAGADAAVLVTAWPEFRSADWAALAPRMRVPLLVDGRGALRGLRLPRELRYVPIGRGPEPGDPGVDPERLP